jgi:hypothetical protein
MWRRDTKTGLISLLLATVAAVSARAGDPIYCRCGFDSSSGYSAVGTRAVCSSFTKEKACTIAFGGLGAQSAIANSIGVDPRKLADDAFKLTLQNLDAVRTGTLDRISNVDYLREAIVVYMRAAYLREDARIDAATLKDLDQEVQSFAKELSGQIADVFASKRPPFETQWKDRHTIDVERGALRFAYNKEITVVAVFFRAEQR